MNWFSVTRAAHCATVTIRDGIGSFDVRFNEFRDAIGDADEVELIIDSTGGCAFTAIKVRELLKTRNTTALVTGNCLSAALIISLAANRIEAYEGTRFMAHRAVVNVTGNVDELASAIATLDQIDVQITAQLMARTKQAPETVSKWLAGEGTWFTAGEAMAGGLIDGILPRPSPTRFELAQMQSSETDEERLALALLGAIGPIQCMDRSVFIEKLNAWAINVR